MMTIITFHSLTLPMTVEAAQLSPLTGNVNGKLMFWCRKVTLSLCYARSEMRGVTSILIFGQVCSAKSLSVALI